MGSDEKYFQNQKIHPSPCPHPFTFQLFEVFVPEIKKCQEMSTIPDILINHLLRNPMKFEPVCNMIFVIPALFSSEYFIEKPKEYF
jgi:hypothetical protein